MLEVTSLNVALQKKMELTQRLKGSMLFDQGAIVLVLLLGDVLSAARDTPVQCCREGKGGG